MAKVYVYQRVSTDEQNTQSQEQQVTAWLAAHGMTADEVVADEGVSGGVSYRDRNLGLIVVPKLRRGDTLIVSEISRLGRSMSDINRLVAEELKPRGVRLVVVQMGIDLNCAEIRALDEMLLFAFGFAAQLEKELIQTRTKAALDARKKLLEEHGEFISKQGRVVTHLGREKGCDNRRATQASAEAKKQRAVNDENNRRIWAIIKDAETKQQKEQAAQTLNFMHITLPSGLPFTYKRVCEVRNRQMRMFRKISIQPLTVLGDSIAEPKNP